jgi:hypothetical protein
MEGARMDTSDFNNITSAIQNIIAALAILVGGIWALFKFVIYRESYPKVQFDLDLRILDKIQNQIVVEVVAIVENKGLVRHWLNDFKFDLFVLPKDKALVEGDKNINYQIQFEKVVDGRYWIPPDWKTTFIDPSLRQEYTYVTHIPDNSSLALIYATFRYPDEESNFHAAQKTFRVELKPSEQTFELKPSVEGI